eukprot:TRINITY_DN19868_c0_g1_i1.p1 TRINITY_DN19868_c0_g1~~TRINITY_DN19868_c0_g1_i1.p1  ORF type:complete len:202 (+),score=51.23 TRINITY_DN19868_c0_g1_i1:75-680(+)
MLSGSSYQPLPSLFVNPLSTEREGTPHPFTIHAPEDESVPLTGESSAPPGLHEEHMNSNKFELTNIAVISSNNNNNAATAVVARNTMEPSLTPPPPSHNTSSGVPRGSIARDFIVTNGEEKGNWTNFHFVMCVGIVGFFVFWIVLLCRMYLPAQFQTWIYGISPEGNNSSSSTSSAKLRSPDTSSSIPPPTQTLIPGDEEG